MNGQIEREKEFVNGFLSTGLLPFEQTLYGLYLLRHKGYNYRKFQARL